MLEPGGNLKKPEVNQKVIVANHWVDRVQVGTVQAVLSTQFTFVDDDDGQVYFCYYNGEWKDNEH